MKSMLKKIFFKLLGERKKDYIRVILSGIFCISVIFFLRLLAAVLFIYQRDDGQL